MKKLLLFSLLSVALPLVAMQPQAPVNVLTPHTPGLYIHPTVNRFTGNDAPASPSVMHIVHDDKPQIIDYPGAPSSFMADPTQAQAIDANGRNVIWWAALMGKKNLYNALVKIGANPNIKSSSGILAGFSAAELIKMSPEEIEVFIEAGPNASKSKLK